jgi:hypothetical protein
MSLGSLWSLFDSLVAQAKNFPYLLKKRLRRDQTNCKYTGNFAQEVDVYDSYDESS